LVFIGRSMFSRLEKYVGYEEADVDDEKELSTIGIYTTEEF